MTARDTTQNSPGRGGALVNGGGVSRATPATLMPPDFHASMLRVLTTLDELAAIFMRLDADIRAMARAGLTETDQREFNDD